MVTSITMMEADVPSYERYRRISIVNPSVKPAKIRDTQHSSTAMDMFPPKTVGNRRRVVSAHSRLFRHSTAVIHPSETPLSPISPVSDNTTMEDIPDLISHTPEMKTRPVYAVSSNGLEIGPYRIERKLGVGSFSEVKLATDTRTGQPVALKMMSKQMLRESERLQICVQREIEITEAVRHPNIVGFIEAFETSSHLVLVLEYISGYGELYDYIVDGKCSVARARDLFYELASAVAYLHSKNICHRDIKLENVLVDSSHHVHICDFGLARTFTPGEVFKTRCGSEDYACPEIILGCVGYNPINSDSWALGVILFAMLVGELPFQPGPGGAVKPMYHKIARGDYRWPSNIDVPEDAKDVVRALLQPNPSRRMTALEALNSPWLSRGDNKAGVCGNEHHDGSGSINKCHGSSTAAAAEPDVMRGLGLDFMNGPSPATYS
ncbi:hypothetical protein SmJEL517_g01373 [Synchytrium microbalum]|uniref:Protein kinase domain-containing protein n=1 Tax=Synchytrium microbalum TaxID=1806994 RepID=A0A507CB00_9FUNG|nr:uncharacterized protein SmJEL517_g01373 [Synchytrium microbalum]TPX36528.1 hypothetical protein SmJEL517_g01373 [Synchytrium microbalum]